MATHVFSFGESRAEGHDLLPPEARKSVLGGKGAGLAEMSAAGLPVPPGYTVSCQACLLFQKQGRLPPEIEEAERRALELLEERMGRRLGDPRDPLLVSVRSGAPKSMPGMMDTILNLGLNGQSVRGLAERTGNPRFAWDAYRRLLTMFGAVVLDVPKAHFEEKLAQAKRRRRVKHDFELPAEVLEGEVVPAFLAIIEKEAGRAFPADVHEQLRMARDAVFRSWNNPRAREYRRTFGIPDDLGTAVNVQAMVFGNKGETSATGVGFTRDPGTGARTFYGEYLQNAQGEDVVAGIRTPRRIEELGSEMPGAFAELKGITDRLERTYRWPQDFEFTIEDGKLYMLQTRDAKSTARAAVRWAMDFLDAGLLDEEEALLRVDPAALDQLLHPVFDPAARRREKPVTRGLPAGPGAASGSVVFTAEDAVKGARAGKRVVLVRAETSPDDIAGMIASQGILTATGGMTSHAAVVGRQMGKPCVVGAGAIEIDEKKRLLKVDGRTVREGDPVSIDGATGEVFLVLLPTVDSEVLRGVQGRLTADQSEVLRDYLRLQELADRHRRLGVRANADRPRDARMAFELGARGIGLCRTEHMFFEGDRIPIVQRMILAAARGREGVSRRDAAKARGPAGKQELAATMKVFGDDIRAYEGALKELLPLQRADFYGLFKEMRGHAVTVRTLDPPLHEFLPRREELLVAREALRCGRTPEGWRKLEAQLRPLAPALGKKKSPGKAELVELVLRRVEELHEFNPMLGHRGCRLGITYPEITQMQARALFEAAARCKKEGMEIHVEVMVPLVGTVQELSAQKEVILRVKAEVERARGVALSASVGTMIEVPRAALMASEIAAEAAFFSFGTNDLTQMTFGYSRDDSGKFLHDYVERRILPGDPFASLDEEGVGKLVRMAVEEGRRVRSDIKLGICGEHGGDPRSIRFCHRAGLDYVSCSPFRVPVARLAAAHAAIEERRERSAGRGQARALAGGPARATA